MARARPSYHPSQRAALRALTEFELDHRDQFLLRPAVVWLPKRGFLFLHTHYAEKPGTGINGVRWLELR
jgi:hypothetical protein